MNKTVKLMLAAACLAAGMAQGEPAIKDQSVLGWWRFDSEGESCVRVTPWMGNVDRRWHGIKERGTEKENVKAALECAD